MSEETDNPGHFVTREDCLKGRAEVVRKLDKLDSTMNGEFGIITILKKSQKDIEYIKKNGRMTGKQRLAFYGSVTVAAITTVGGIIIAVVR